MTRFAPIIVAAAVTLVAPRPASSQTAGPTGPPPAVDAQSSQPPGDASELPPVESTPFWTTRRVVIIAGYAAAIGIGALALSKERDLRARRRAIEALPPGSTDDFNREMSAARDLLGARDLFGAIAVSLAGGTTVYALSPRFAGSNALVPGLRSAGKTVWRVSIAWAF